MNKTRLTLLTLQAAHQTQAGKHVRKDKDSPLSMSTVSCFECRHTDRQHRTQQQMTGERHRACLFWLSQVDDEMDELVLMDDEMMDLPPEDLPRRVLSDFAVYNSEGFCSSLELLPMWSGVDPDVDLYASGNVLDDDGEWAGGQALNTGMCLVLAVNIK